MSVSPFPVEALEFYRVVQHIPSDRVSDVGEAVLRELSRFRSRFPQNASIAVALGSRGIANLAVIARTAIDFLKSCGCWPFIFPAMGSHGGATAEGQAQVLASYGITPESMGCPVVSSMETQVVENSRTGHRLFMDKAAWMSDGILVINRVKPHTDFSGPYESGLVKMSVIGLGKASQAAEIHRFGVRGLRELIPQSFEEILSTGKILLGLAVIENALDETAHVEAVPAESILEREPKLLELARARMPKLPLSELDVLIVDRLGKDVSGTGMDTNVIGRIRIEGQPEPASPRIRSIVACGLTEATHGNATGIGLADVISRSLYDLIDFDATYANIVTSGFLERGKVPVIAPTDRQALELGLRAAVCLNPRTATVIRILDTLHVREMALSSGALEKLRDRPEIQVIGRIPSLFNANGSLAPILASS